VTRRALDLAAHEALRMQLACIAGEEPPSSYFELRPLTRNMRPARRDFIPVSEAQRAVELIGEHSSALNMFVGAAPRIRKAGTAAAVARVWQLWLDLDRPDALELIGDFRPLPSLIISTGSPGHALAHWPLDTPLGPAQAQRANRRLAARLGGDMAATDPARIVRPVSSLNHKHRPPAEVTCTRLETVRFTAAQVVGNLPDSHHYQRPPEGPALVRRAPRLATDDPLRGIPAEEYIPALTGREIGRDRKVRCPFHAGGQERTPSLHVYPGGGGWYCWPCGAGGDIYTFGALLYGIEARGASFHELRERLAEELLAVPA
jgi:hypothetical protein